MKLLSNARMSSEIGVTEDSYRRADKGFIFTRSGKRVYFLGNKEKEIDVIDCCYSLARNYRWNGHTIIPWSVAQHSLLVAKMIEELKWRTPVKNKDLAIVKGLTHDFTEAYLGDLVTPVKREIDLYNNIEKELETKIEEAVDIDKDLTDDEREKFKPVAKKLNSIGIGMVGLDVIDGKIIEVNVTSPCYFIKEIDNHFGVHVEDTIVDYLLKALDCHKNKTFKSCSV